MASFFSGMAQGLSAGRARAGQREAGMLKREQLNLQRQKLGMQQQQLGMQQEQMNEAKASRAANAQISQQFQSVTSQKGLSAGLDYLQSVKPKEALGMKKTIADTRKSILETAKIQAQTTGVNLENKKKQNEVVESGMGLIAAFGSKLGKVPEAEREQVLTAMLPTLQNIDKNFPTDPKKAAAYFQGAMGLSMPQNKIYDAEQKSANAQSDVVKAIEYERKNPNLSASQKKALYSQRDEKINERADEEAKRMRSILASSENKEDSLRKEYTTHTQRFQAVQISADKAIDALALGTAAGDHAGIFGYMKTQDPGSTVREGEFATVQNAGGVSNAIRASYNNLLRGEMLTPKMRKQFVGAIQTAKDAEQTSYDSIRGKYVKIATDRGLDLDRAVPDYSQNKLKANSEKLQQAGIPKEMLGFAVKKLEQGASVESVLEAYGKMKGKGKQQAGPQQQQQAPSAQGPSPNQVQQNVEQAAPASVQSGNLGGNRMQQMLDKAKAKFGGR